MKILHLSPKANQVNREGKGFFLGRKNCVMASVISGCINRGRLCRKREVGGQIFGPAQTTVSSRFSFYLVLLEKTETNWNRSGAGVST